MNDGSTRKDAKKNEEEKKSKIERRWEFTPHLDSLGVYSPPALRRTLAGGRSHTLRFYPKPWYPQRQG